MVVFSGGECTLLGHDLAEMIKYASNRGIRTRIVTNGWWAKTYKIAAAKIKEFKNAGLDEINYSTGDEHQKWVPFKNIRNASVATIRNGLSCAINVETKDNSHFDINKILKKDKVFLSMATSNERYNNDNKIHIEKGIWAPIRRDSQNKITYNEFKNNISFKRCEHLFSIIPINPYGEVLACCGITSEFNPYLRLGNINKEDIKYIYERAFDDILKLWLYTEGPASIAQYINSKKENTSHSVMPAHACILCHKIFNSPRNIEILKNNYSEYNSRVILKYCMLNLKKQKA